MLFLMAAGLTLVFGIMNLVNLAHGSFYMVGAYLATYFYQATGSYLLGVLLGLAARSWLQSPSSWSRCVRSTSASTSTRFSPPSG